MPVQIARVLGLVGLCLTGPSCAGPGRDFEGPSSPPAEASARPPTAQGSSAATTEPTSPVDAGAVDPAGYELRVERPHASFGLAESRGIEPAIMRGALATTADAFERCAANAEREGWLDRAALRMVVEIDAHGEVAGVITTPDDPRAGGKVTLVCLVATVKALNFGSLQSTVRRGFALEVLFGPKL